MRARHRHMDSTQRKKIKRRITNLRVLISTVFGIGALGLGVYLGLTIGDVLELDWAIFLSVLAGLIVGQSFAWGYLDEWELRC